MRHKNSTIRNFVIMIFILALLNPLYSQEKEKREPEKEKPASLLELMDIIPSDESIDYVQNKTQFQLHTLPTEQRHPATWNLSEVVQDDCAPGLEMLFKVDQDIVQKLEQLSQNPETLDAAVKAVKNALFSGNKIYIYGCGATGRLAKQMESTFWRPFWEKIKNQKRIWEKCKSNLKENIEEKLIGEMTGGDRALISSLEGFEDLLLIGELQLKEHKIKKGDVVICVTEGGETSSVIGTILYALDQWKASAGYDPEQSRKKLFFVYNNPDDKLKPFTRSRKVLTEKGITKINLFTGPQAITGSTRMQATTIETFVIGHILQTALDQTLREFLSKNEMAKIGFEKKIELKNKLKGFESILNQVKKDIPEIAELTLLEAETYKSKHFSTYFACDGLITVFIDSTERSPTFRLFPLDTVNQKERQSWIQVWTKAPNLEEAWEAFLKRPFHGLSYDFYFQPFQNKIKDPFLKKAALESLKKAGNDQKYLYDFSFSSSNIKQRGPEPGDLGVLVSVSPEEDLFENKNSCFREFISLFKQNQSNTAVLCVSNWPENKIDRLINKIPDLNLDHKDISIIIPIENQNDPLNINQHIALKITLNAHSTAVMARLGKVVGNTMTNVSPSNLKLIGRATFLIQSHVNDAISSPEWVEKNGLFNHISYGEANAVLFESMKFLKEGNVKSGQTAEVALSIIRILESIRLNKGISQKEAFKIVQEKGLLQYLSNVKSSDK
jgi:N-acetylmuramic acid 6-phosphate (MurNAc-6-P) etherase